MASAVGAVAGFSGTLALVALDAAPFLEDPLRLPLGIGGLVLVGLIAGLVASDRRTWAALVAGVLAFACLELVGRFVFVSVTGPSLLPVDQWRLRLFLGLVAMVGFVSIGLAVGRLLRGWRPTGSWRQYTLPVVRLAGASVVISAALAFGFSTTRLVLGGDLPILTVRITDSEIELSPSVVGDGPYVLIVESAASRMRWLTSVSSGQPTGAIYADMVGLSDHDVAAFFDGAWLVENRLSAPRYTRAAQFELEPGERRYSGEYSFLATSGNSVIWYASEPGLTSLVASCDVIDPDSGGCVEGTPSQAEEVPWPPEERAILTIGAP